MKPTRLLLAAAFFGTLLPAAADLTIPSDGSDGALNITEDTVIDLSQAVTGTWDQNNTANAGKGVYDPEKWAVVFKYTSVSIAGNTTGTPSMLVGKNVTFRNHPSHAPVVWLVQGDVTVAGKLFLSGKPGTTNPIEALKPIEAGPGGFRGAAAGPSGSGNGYGPDGGTHWAYNPNGRYASSYGNPQIIPLIGGSGALEGGNLGGGGGAILIVAQNIAVTGVIDASGGSGGAIRLVAKTVTGDASINNLRSNLNAMPNGRIRIEGVLSPALISSPETIGVPPANPPAIWPAANVPKARVLSVDAVNAPADPTSPLIAAADVAIQNNAPVNILIETRDFPIEGVVQLAVIPKFAGRSWLTATRLSGDINLATWRVTTTLPNGFVTLQARATQP